MNDFAMERPKKKIRGWLLFLIVYFALLIPATFSRNAKNEATAIANFVSEHPTLGPPLQIRQSISLIVAFVSIYAAYVLGRKQPDAVAKAKRALLVILALALLASLLMPLWPGVPNSMRPVFVKSGIRSAVLSSIQISLWYTYLVRSKRVRETYSD